MRRKDIRFTIADLRHLHLAHTCTGRKCRGVQVFTIAESFYGGNCHGKDFICLFVDVSDLFLFDEFRLD
ncbi:MAG TPA: hypothetical protein VFR47_06425 [Anaerolineales bacterium]|nr:hypothetical protein [Anaerolineales bacterium]